MQDQFQAIEYENKIKKIIKGENSPMIMDSQGISINEYLFQPGDHSIDIKTDFIHSLFIISGSLIYETSKIDKGTFIKLDNIPEINFKVTESAKVFEIISPKKLSYKTYSNMRQF